ncbi:hypothetical protein QQ020_30045 [Fulvivirgaceae bacterium BMA12]|uniref:Lipoprotein n=1 Tax=Agaribacillus aureus TaxID=3051825 RepID=A0ABT8LJ88_9BACT|nr:hypothetical protein [Fulvivirgaceae bacterium BMA12]
MKSFYNNKTVIWAIACASIIGFQFCGENESPANDQPVVPDSDSTATLIKRDTSFLPGIPQGLVVNEALQEASGIAVSRSNPQLIWAHNDSGDLPRIFLLGSGGDDFGEFRLVNAKNRDWEDIAIGPGPEEGKNYLYIGDIGDNISQYEEKIIYRVEEPDVSSTDKKFDGEIKSVEAIKLKFPDGIRDAETLMIDPANKDLYIISKRESKVGVYRLKYPYATDLVNVLEKVGEMALTGVVGGDISSDGNEVLIKTYQTIYYWKKTGDEDIGTLLLSQPVSLPYFREPQGEAIAWKLDGSGYYTLSEEPRGIDASIYYYMRL